MNRRNRFCVLLVFMISANLTHGEDLRPRKPVTLKPGETDTNFENYKPLAEQVAMADRVVLYEGLPHQTFEGLMLKEELRTKQTVQHHGFPFYAEPLQLKDEDAKNLTKLFTDPNSLKPFAGYKKCGGYHPDYSIEWHVGQEVYRCLVCLGCKEVKVFGPTSELYCSITAENYDQFLNLLQPHRQHRPTKTDFGYFGFFPSHLDIVDRITLFEAVPHKTELKDNEKAKATVQHFGFSFNAEPHELKYPDVMKLKKFFGDVESFSPFSGYKECGGFHPDYCLEWHMGANVEYCLISFSCREVKMFAGKSELYCDIARGSYERFKQIIEPYSKHHPPKSKDD